MDVVVYGTCNTSVAVTTMIVVTTMLIDLYKDRGKYPPTVSDFHHVKINRIISIRMTHLDRFKSAVNLIGLINFRINTDVTNPH